jgi:uncharacterized protein YwbE
MSVRRSAVTRLGAALAAGVAIAACGSSSHHPARTTHTAPATTPKTTTTPASKTPTSSVTTGPVHATLTGENHHPVAGRSWSYEVKVTDAAGHPLAGTVLTEFVYPSVGVVGKESPPTHRLKNGVLKDSLTFPPSAVGHTVELQTVVHTSRGSVTLDWPVTTVK